MGGGKRKGLQVTVNRIQNIEQMQKLRDPTNTIPKGPQREQKDTGATDILIRVPR